jgi:hypothetical protein
VKLVARLSPEGPTLVRADLGRHAQLTQKAERPPRRSRAGEIEVQRDLPTSAQVQAAGRVRQTRELGEPVAIPLRGDPGQLVPELLRQ